MARKWENFRAGNLGASLTASGTTITFDANPGFATVSSPDHIVLILDPYTSAREIVYLTAYTSGATTGTIQRAKDGTTGVVHSNGARWLNGPVASDMLYSVPVGTVFTYAGTAAPDGWLVCSGAAVSRTTYAELFAIIGTAFGAGDGSTTFNTPMLLDRFIMGVGSANVGSGGGQLFTDLAQHSHTSGTLSAPAHTHDASGNYVAPSHSHSASGTYALAHTHGVGNISHNHGNGNLSATHWHNMAGAGSANQAVARGGSGSFNTVLSGGYDVQTAHTTDTSPTINGTPVVGTLTGTSAAANATAITGNSGTPNATLSITGNSGGASSTTISGSTANAGTSVTENRPPFVGLLPIIKF